MPITLKSDPAGTGLFTVQNPNTSTNRTITLPDASGTVYTTDSILGTVSQLAGIPSGAIIETGSNSNGEYTKFANGLLVCYHRLLITPTAANTPTSVTWTFPVAYASLPWVFTSAGTTVPGTTVTGTSSFAQTLIDASIYVTRTNTTTTTVNVFVIGKWF